MRIRISFSLFASFLLTAASGIGLRADTLDGALNHLDRAGSQFKGMTANVQYLKHTAIVNEDSVSTGTIKIKRIKRPQPPDELMGLFDFVSPDKKIVSLTKKTVDIYLPNIKTVQEVDLSKHPLLVEQFFLLGFGTSRSDLERAYDVSYGGTDTINGESVTRLVMISKDPGVTRQLSKIELLISDKTGQPVQQKLYEPSHGQAVGDYNVFTYSDMKINPNLPDSALKLKLPSNVKKEILNK